MSYTIFYRAMFVKMRDGSFIPMIESGDNNVCDVDRNRRSREWSSCRWRHEGEEQRKLYAISEYAILASAQREVDSNLERYVGTEPAFGGEPYKKEDVLKDLGFFNGIKISGHGTTTASQFLNFIKSGIRNAVTMEDLSGGVFLSWWKEHGFQKDYVRDEDELSEKWQKCLSEGITPWICISEGIAESAWEKVRERNRKPRAEREKPSGEFVIAFDYGGCEWFVVKLTSRNLQYNQWKEYAYKYTSKKLAENACERIARRFSQLSNIRVLSYV